MKEPNQNAHNLIALTEWAAMYGIDRSNASRKAAKGGYQTAVKIGRNWLISADEVPSDLRERQAGAKMEQAAGSPQMYAYVHTLRNADVLAAVKTRSCPLGAALCRNRSTGIYFLMTGQAIRSVDQQTAREFVEKLNS